MSKFIKVEAWDMHFTESWQEIINVSKVDYVCPCRAYHVNDVVINGVDVHVGEYDLRLKMSIDECLEMLNGAKDG